jgi:hypothetical protein
VTGISCLPTDFDKTVTKILRTTSVSEFNQVFDLSADERKAKMYGTAFTHPTVETQLQTAQSIYKDLVADNSWLTVTKSASTFAALKADMVCWNCGQTGHSFPQCPKAKNEAKIEAAKAAHKQARSNAKTGGRGRGQGQSGGRGNEGNVTSPSNKTNTTSNGGCGRGHGGRSGRGGRSGGGTNANVSKSTKWAAPTPNEQQHGSRRLIDGKSFTWNADRKYWIPDVSNIQPPAPSSDVSVITQSTNATATPEQLANLANTHRAADQLSSTMGQLLRSFTP